MINFKLKVTLLALALFVIAPHTSLAYFTTAQSAVQLNSDTLLYTVTYKFGMERGALHMPIGAVRNLQAGDASPYLGYTLLNNGEAVIASGTTAAFVFSDAKVVDNEYFVPKGKSATFTLVTLVKLGKDFTVSEDEKTELSLQVTSLPFNMVGADGSNESITKLKLNPSELQYYITPELKLK